MHSDVMSYPVIASQPGMAYVTNLPSSSASWVTFDELLLLSSTSTHTINLQDKLMDMNGNKMMYGNV